MMLALRPATAGDRDVLLDVYGSVREEELSLVDWSAAQKRAFVEMQFSAQDSYYREHYPGASFDLVLVDGKPAGRLYVARWPGEIRIVDIALLPAFRGRGIGTRLLRGLIAEARAATHALTTHVEVGSPARRLYERLGFVGVEDRGLRVLMRREP